MRKMIFPANVILEVSALCNLSCLGCALHGPFGFVERPFGNMKREIWEPVLREVGSWQKEVALMAHGGGEPLLNPQFREILELAAEFPLVKTGFLTNGMLLDEKWADFIIDLELDWIAFSVDGTDPVTHDRIRKGSNLVKVERNLEALMELKKSRGARYPEIKLNMVAYDDIADQQDGFVKKWVDRVDAVMISHYRNPPESKRWPDIPQKRNACPLLWSQAVVAWDGRIGLCCEDFNIDHSPGRVGENGMSLLDLWNGPLLSEVRRQHSEGDFEGHPMCSICDSWAEESGRVIETHPDGYQVVKSPSQTVYSKI